jgi:hypothetical protein
MREILTYILVGNDFLEGVECHLAYGLAVEPLLRHGSFVLVLAVLQPRGPVLVAHLHVLVLPTCQKGAHSYKTGSTDHQEHLHYLVWPGRDDSLLRKILPLRRVRSPRAVRTAENNCPRQSLVFDFENNSCRDRIGG